MSTSIYQQSHYTAFNLIMQGVLTMTNEEIIREIKKGNRVQENMYLLYAQNLTLLKLWSKKYIKVLGDEDVLQECYIAVHKAVQGFDESKEYKFTSYLQKAVQTHLSRTSNISTNSKLGINDKRLLAQYIELNKQHQQRTGNNIPLSQAADQLHCSQKVIERISQYLSIRYCTSIDNPICDGSGDDLNVIEVLPDKTDIEKDYEQQDNKEQLKQVWSYIDEICTDRQYDIINQHYKSNKTLEQIAIDYNITPQRIREIEQQGFKRLRNDEQFIQWANSFDYCIDMSYHYGFNTWRNNGSSAVEMATEVRERYKQWMAEKEYREKEIQRKIMIDDMISKGLLLANHKY